MLVEEAARAEWNVQRRKVAAGCGLPPDLWWALAGRHRLVVITKGDLRDQHRAPILMALKARRDSSTVPFTTPGHKLGAGADPHLVQLLGADLFANDIWLNRVLRDLGRQAEGAAA